MTPADRVLKLSKNPLIVKDLRTRLRGMKAYILISAHLVALGLAVAVVFLVSQSTLSGSGNLQERRFLGKAIFGLLVWLELVMISFVAPALTSGSVSLERERQTFDLLRVTLISSRQIVLGKFLPGLTFVCLLLLTSVPMQGPAFLLGGVLWQEILIATLILLVTTAAFCAFGLLLSCLIRRTLISTTLAYATTIFVVFGVPVMSLLALLLFGTRFPMGFDALSASTIRVLLTIAWSVISLTPVGAMIGTEVILLDQQNLIRAEITVGRGITFVTVSPWIPYVIAYLLISLLFLWLSEQLLSRPEK